MSNKALNKTPEWSALEAHQKKIQGDHIRAYFKNDPKRFDKCSLGLDGLLLDYSKHKLHDDTLPLLVDLAKARGVEEWRDKMFAGEILNASEKRAVLHVALRGSVDPALEVDGENVAGFVSDTLSQVQALSEEIRNNPNITDVINIGIGGSDLGPRMIYKALLPHKDGPNLHFISNIDGRAIEQRLKGLKPENTALIITSKSFATLETITNAETIKGWFLDALSADVFAERLFAISTNIEAATAFGVPEHHILPLRDWIGGRFSLWSAVGLSTAAAIGFDGFKALLDGAKAMDQHFKTAPMEQNMPIIMGMIGVWYRNFWDYSAKAILPYSHDLRDLHKYLQQLDMESNGKGVDRDGAPVEAETGPIIFGEAGTNAQHAFMQLLHQGPDIIPADFILVAKPEHPYKDHHDKLLANALAQSKALMDGKASANAPHKAFEGNRPSSSIVLDRLDPYNLGMLLALYEHVIFVQGVIWGINSFDQWGVELGKVLAKTIQNELKNQNSDTLDSSTEGLLKAISTH